MHAYCKAKGIGIIPWGPLFGGALARLASGTTTRSPDEKPFTDADKAIISRVEEVAKKKGWKMNEVALSWVASKVTSPIVGCSTVRIHLLTFSLRLYSLAPKFPRLPA